MAETVILGYARTPLCKVGGALSDVSAVELGAHAIQAALSRAAVLPEQVEEVVMGMVVQAGAGQVPARQAAVQAGIPWTTPAETVNKVCASGMRAILLADQIIRSGDASVVVAGGMESMSNAPYLLKGARFGLRMGDVPFLDAMTYDGLRCPFHEVPMVIHGSNVAAEYEISREEQDAYALRSHLRAAAALQAGHLQEEIEPIRVKGARGSETYVSTDEGIRPDTTLEKLAALRPVNGGGTITPGNAPGVYDGACALILAEAETAKKMGWTPLATLLSHAEVGQAAPYIATTPGLAVLKLLDKTGYSQDQIDLFEINEAFAAVVLTSQKLVEWREERVNVNGGAISLGHPIGASGARIVGSLIYELGRRGGGLGIAAICSGTAQGDALLLKVNPKS